MEAQFHIGQMVCLRAEPARQGSVIQILPPVGGRHRYKVFHSGQEIREYYEEQLLPVATSATGDPIAQAMRDGQWLPPDDFHARLTAMRLAHPLTDSLYALHSARIKFIPFQFKPLLRLLRSDRPRLLIADEVGLGKTIEAGLLIRQAWLSRRAKRILILAPKAVLKQWQIE